MQRFTAAVQSIRASTSAHTEAAPPPTGDSSPQDLETGSLRSRERSPAATVTAPRVSLLARGPLAVARQAVAFVSNRATSSFQRNHPASTADNGSAGNRSDPQVQAQPGWDQPGWSPANSVHHSIDDAWGTPAEEQQDDRWSDREWAPSETHSLTANAAPMSSDGESTITVNTVFNPELKLGLNLGSLYRNIAGALPADHQLHPPIRQNVWLTDGDGGVERAEASTRDYRAALGHVGDDASNLNPTAGGESTVEGLESLSRHLSGLLARKPPASDAAPLAKEAAQVAAALSKLHRKAKSDPMVQACLAVCEQKLRAVVVDMASSLQGRPLVELLEGAYAADTVALLRCTIELPGKQQGEFFDGSKLLRSSLDLRSGWRGRLASKAAKSALASGGPIPLSEAMDGWIQAAVHSSKNAVKDRAVRHLEKRLDARSWNGASPLDRFKRSLGTTRPRDLPLFELRERFVPRIGEALMFMGQQTMRASTLVNHQTWNLREDDKAKMAASLLVTRAAISARQDDTIGVDKPALAGIDRMIDNLYRYLTDAFAQLRDDAVAAAMVPWLTQYVSGKSSPSLKLRELATSVHRTVTEMPDGPRRDLLLQGLLDTKNTLPYEHPAQLLINSAIRVAGGPWLERTGRSDLMDAIKAQELDLYPKFMAQGHSFEKHVEGRDNRNGKEFDRLLGSGGDRPARRQKYEDHIRHTMASATDLVISSVCSLHFYNAQTQTCVIADPRRRDGGTAFTKDPAGFQHRKENMVYTPLPADSYASFFHPPAHRNGHSDASPGPSRATTNAAGGNW